MKRYKLRPGVVLIEVCGEQLLVATKEAREHCPYVTEINAAAAEYFRVLEQEDTLPGLVREMAKTLGREEKEVLFPALGFLSKMESAGYLIAEELP